MQEQDIWHLITAPDILQAGFEKVRRNGGMAGGDGVTIGRYARSLRKNLSRLCDALRSGTYQPGECRQFLVPKSGNRVRRLMVPTVEDRVVHTAIANVLSPMLEPLFEETSFAYRPGRSVQQAVHAIERWRDDGYRHVIEADISNYFDSIDHEKLLAVLRRSLPDTMAIEQLLDFLEGEFNHQARQLDTNGKGLVQGSPMSLLLSNLYLDVLDEEIHGRGIRIIRFADDFVILCKELSQVESAVEEMGEILASLGLELNPAKTRIVDFEKGFEFLGYLFVRSLAMKKSGSDTERPAAPPVGKQTRRDLDSAAEQPAASPAETTEPDRLPERGNHAKGDRILYVMEKGRRISADGRTISVWTPEANEVLTLPAHGVDRIVAGPQVEVLHSVLSHCGGTQTELALVNGFGETTAWLTGRNDWRGRLQFEQARTFVDSVRSVEFARKLVEARIRNQRTQLFRLNRKAKDDDVAGALKRMKYHLRKLEHATSVDQLRGLEGASGREYWPALGALCDIHAGRFTRQRPARDPLNAAINYLTAMLERDVRSAILESGLHTGFGALHVPQDRGEAAVYDLMEPFRAPLTEGLAVYLFNARRLRPDLFRQRNDAGIRINRDGQNAIIRGYESYVVKRVNITGRKGKLAWRPMMLRNAQGLAKAVRRGDVSLFQPYLMEA